MCSVPISDGCGGTWTANQGVLTTPNHPGNYPHSARCEYTIAVTAGMVIRLSFHSFQLEGSSPRCPYDSVTIYDGLGSNGTQIGRWGN